MAVYMVSQLSIHDRDEYAKYESQFMQVFDQFEGKLLSVDDNPAALAGELQANRVVIAEFPSKKTLLAWLMSEDYQRISVHREAGSSIVSSVMVNDLHAAPFSNPEP